MPGRYLREGILTSPPVNQLPPLAELFYRRLMSVVDDHGRFFADPLLLRSYCFPMKPDLRATDISQWLAACEQLGLVAVYEVASVRYLVFAKLGEASAKTSKYPTPPECLESARICKQVLPDVPDNDNAQRATDNAQRTTHNGQRITGNGSGASPPGFDEFWRDYPNKKAKGEAVKSWVKMNGNAILPKILAAIQSARHSDAWTKDGGRFIPHPSTWLNQQRWEDEHAPAHKAGNGMRENIKCPIIDLSLL